MTIKEIQKAILDLLRTAKAATFSLNHTFTLSIDEGIGLVNFEDDGKEFSPEGYDERDTIIGVGIGMEDNTLWVATSDSEGNTNFLKSEDVPMPKKDWTLVLNTLREILAREGAIAEDSVEDAVNKKIQALSEALLKMRR